MGKQTAIHEQVLITQSTQALMELDAKWASDYDRNVNETWGYSGPDRTRYGLSKYLEPEGARVLDAGCGTSFVGVALRSGRCRQIDGVDYSQPMLRETAKKGVYQHLERMNLNIALPIDTGVYDDVTCVGTFTSAHVVPEALNERVRVTRTDGIVCCTVREESWQHTYFSEVLDRIIRAETAKLLALCEEPYVHSEHSICKMVVLQVERP